MQLSDLDFSPKGIWIKYLRLEKRWPDQIVLEEEEFSNGATAEKWAKEREKHWIKKFKSAEVYLLNSVCWWLHPERKQIPKSVRFSWEQFHHILFRLQHWLSNSTDLYNRITQFQAVRGIREIVKEYPSLEVRPIGILDELEKN